MMLKITKLLVALLFIASIIGCGSAEKENTPNLAENQKVSLPINGEPSPTNLIEESKSFPLPIAGMPPISNGPITAPFISLSSGGGRSHKTHHHGCNKTCELGVAIHNAPDLNWYIVNTESFPNVKPLSLYRNAGNKKGLIELTDTGLEVKVAGTYWISFSATMAYFNEDDNGALIPIFLIKNEVFEPNDINSLLGVTQSLLPNFVMTLNGSGALFDLQVGDTLSLVITNGGSPEPIPITILAWGITAHRICD